MIAKEQEKSEAIMLRKQGLTYREILAKVPVAKSTLSLWLQEVGLSQKSSQRLTQKKLLAGRRGGLAKRAQRIEREKAANIQAKGDIKSISARELWLIGVALYWAEGSKQKPWSPSVGISFANSDPKMVKVFMRWLRDVIHVPESDIAYRIYLHESHRHRLVIVQNIWHYTTGLSREACSGVSWKKGGRGATERKNVGDAYIGLVQISVKRSTALNRKVSAWSERMAEILA